jgi:hypothetical protein
MNERAGEVSRARQSLVAEDETARINELADELNIEAEDVLEYQVIS